MIQLTLLLALLVFAVAVGVTYAKVKEIDWVALGLALLTLVLLLDSRSPL